MKFKAFLTDNGINLLEKRILPALDKIGRSCHLYLTRDHAFFLHNLLHPDGVHSVAQFNKHSLFHDYRISSHNDDRIAFSLDLPLLHRALRSILAIYADSRDLNPAGVQIKLVKKLPPHSTQAAPFLTLEAKGHKSAVIQDVPVSKPLSRADVLELQLALEASQEMPATLVRAPDLNSLQSFVDRMKHVGDVMGVTVTKYGDLHLQISTSLITLGAEFRKLMVLGERESRACGDENLSAQARIERAVQRQDAMRVEVSVKHFFRCLQYSLAKPDCAFYGIAPQGACLVVIFQFFVPGTRQTDKSISLHCRLPVLDPGSN
ncbi:Hus1 protein [Striga asiatica]|uniref:Checkpoint protein n=1 Tax=Striga asiatica TaxID=4170 RepID=A0A5A7QGU7_STRAF|nr:Hus1 protein [Striga asiatica]